MLWRTWAKSGMNSHDQIPDWSGAPEGWNWQAQDEDGRWFWYRVRPEPSIGGGVWRAPSRAQQLARQEEPNPDWVDTLLWRPCWKKAPTTPGWSVDRPRHLINCAGR